MRVKYTDIKLRSKLPAMIKTYLKNALSCVIIGRLDIELIPHAGNHVRFTLYREDNDGFTKLDTFEIDLGDDAVRFVDANLDISEEAL